MMTEIEFENKYPEDTDPLDKDSVEVFICTKHQEVAVFIRDEGVTVHDDGTGDECY